MENNRVKDNSMFLNEDETHTQFHSQILNRQGSLLKGSASGKTVGFIDHDLMINRIRGELNLKKKRPKLV